MSIRTTYTKKLINLAVLAVALAVVATLACIAAGRDGR